MCCFSPVLLSFRVLYLTARCSEEAHHSAEFRVANTAIIILIGGVCEEISEAEREREKECVCVCEEKKKQTTKQVDSKRKFEAEATGKIRACEC
jgi:hypothetical protein